MADDTSEVRVQQSLVSCIETDVRETVPDLQNSITSDGPCESILYSLFPSAPVFIGI